MIATIAGTAGHGITATIAKLRLITRTQAPIRKTKRGSLAAPPFANLLCRFGSALETRMFHERRAPQERCDQLWCGSKPGGVVIVPPELLELTACLYARDLRIASEETVNTRFPQHLVKLEDSWGYLMNRVSRSWSRPTKDFIVR